MGQITNLNASIADLEAQNQALDQRANSLSNTIEGLNSQISDTEQKLASSETNNTFLTAELQNQMKQRADLERQFNDLGEVRGQVKKLRDELFVARRLEWMRTGVDSANQPKGAELLMHPSPASAASARPPLGDLNVEVGSDGSVHVIPPLTNSPPATNPPSFLQ
jgi:chromosome segregation ATPase